VTESWKEIPAGERKDPIYSEQIGRYTHDRPPEVSFCLLFSTKVRVGFDDRSPYALGGDAEGKEGSELEGIGRYFYRHMAFLSRLHWFEASKEHSTR
jgi:hypothetical protein